MADTKTQSQQMEAFAIRVATEIKKVYSQVGTLANLKTTDKTAIVAAINETVDSISAAQTTLNDYAKRLSAVETKASTNASDIAAAKGNITTLQTSLGTLQTDLKALQDKVNAQTEIDDTAAATDKTYSSSKIESEITAAKQAVKDDLLGGAGAAYDTLKELADLIDVNKTAIDALKEVAAGHVKYDAAQSLTDVQKKQARDNIGAGAAADVTSHGTRLTAVEKKATDNATAITNLKNAVGDTTVDLVAKFKETLNATA